MAKGGSSYSGYRGWKGWSSKGFGVADASERAYFAAEMRRCGVGDLRNAAVLEIGFGNGSFAAWARERGARYQGTEQILELVQAAREHGFDVHEGAATLESFVALASLDLVVAFDVFEHVEQGRLRELLRSIRRCLKPAGLLAVRVPSGESPFSRAMQHGDLTHCTVLTASSIQQLAGETGLEIVSVREPAFPLRGEGVRSYLRRSLVVGVRRVVYPVITVALMGGGHPVLTPDLVAVLRRPREASERR